MSPVPPSPLLHLSRPTLLDLALSLETGRLHPPYSEVKLSASLGVEADQSVIEELQRLDSQGMAPEHIAYGLRLVSQERQNTQSMRDRSELVWTGESPEFMRDTRAVVRDLFTTTRQSILISSYAMDHGQKAQELFSPLAQQMDDHPNLEAQVYLNIPRRFGDTRASDRLLTDFATRFGKSWPGDRLPQLFYDPRSLSTDFHKRACLHAKCIVSDNERVFITSANFTEAAHRRNIEAGVLLKDASLAQTLSGQFQDGVTSGRLRPLSLQSSS
ncbi:MAG: phospholipase [Phormidium sp. GEM2.Bin31]|nr:MAG: phospholipase [Phormidium sp. GEM2.Bin31]UCJ12417.1 MAG: DISARM system phospholipase D-like protein DrmC [Phormidium sp. PBR-2020]